MTGGALAQRGDTGAWEGEGEGGLGGGPGKGGLRALRSPMVVSVTAEYPQLPVPGCFTRGPCVAVLTLRQFGVNC